MAYWDKRHMNRHTVFLSAKGMKWIIGITCGLDGRVLRTDPSRAVWLSYGQHPSCPQLTHTLGSRAHEVHRFNNRMCRYGKMEPYKKCQKLLEGFVWHIDTGRLMGDAVSDGLAF